MKTILITGGLGFIGINAALRFKDKYRVILFDSLIKKSSRENYKKFKNDFEIHPNCIEDKNDLDFVFKKSEIDICIHLAAQTAVTKSIEDPEHDFYTNVVGTFNLLECIREFNPDCKLIYASTNKVYGELRYIEYDIDETESLDFYTPYGCSKGAADQYVIDYGRTYGLNTYVCRQSCIYGKYQDGTEDQGWVAWFVKQFIQKGELTIYGNGEQIRDLLYIDDLIDFYELLIQNDYIDRVFNIGGGQYNKISLLELIQWLENYFNYKIPVKHEEKRKGDQMQFVSENFRAYDTGWWTTTSIDKGLKKLLIEYLQNGA
jgi:CDP-paratose 2-epimerase